MGTTQSSLLRRVRKAINREIVKKGLFEYFQRKGLTDPHALVMPNLLIDMESDIPELHGKIEVRPWNEDHDPFVGVLRARWNLFVLGINRMDLGKTVHTNINDLTEGSSLQHPDRAEPTQNVASIMTFVLRVLGKSEHGFEPLPQGASVQVPHTSGLRGLSGVGAIQGRGVITLP